MSYHDNHDRNMIILAAGLLFALLALFFAGWIFSSAMEANAFNRLTGGHATTWDAMWTELRVVDQPKRGGE